MATQIQVKLDTTATPPVTLIPEHPSVNRGNSTIEWTPFANQSFTFTSLTFTTPGNPFSNISVTNGEVTAQDNNQGPGDYPYVVVVTSGGTQYSSASGGIGGTGGGATIKNN